MRKLGLIIVFIFFGITLLNNLSKEEEIRVRVIPNSDESRDLLEKEEAKELVICYLKEAYSSDYNEFISNINKT